jgi:hypothetical protein
MCRRASSAAASAAIDRSRSRSPGPVLEGGRAGNVESGKEGAGVEGECGVRVAGRHGVLEDRDVAGQRAWRNPDLALAPELQDVVANGAADPAARAMLDCWDTGPAPAYVPSGASVASRMQQDEPVAAPVRVTIPVDVTEQPSPPVPVARLTSPALFVVT